MLKEGESAKSVNLAFQGGGALGLLYTGVVDAVCKHDLKVGTAVGTSAGSLGALLVALKVPREDLLDFATPGRHSDIGKPEEIQDIIPESIAH